MRKNRSGAEAEGKRGQEQPRNSDRELEGVVVVVSGAVVGRIEVAPSPQSVTMADGEINIDSLIQRLLEGEMEIMCPETAQDC